MGRPLRSDRAGWQGAVYARTRPRAACFPNACASEIRAVAAPVSIELLSLSEVSYGSALAADLPLLPSLIPRRLALRSRHYDDWTIESWRIEPRLRPRDVDIDE